MIDGLLVHEILEDGDGIVFKTVSLGEYPQIPHVYLIGTAIHGEHVMDLFFFVKDAGGRTIKKEHMGEHGVHFGYDVVVC